VPRLESKLAGEQQAQVTEDSGRKGLSTCEEFAGAQQSGALTGAQGKGPGLPESHNED
jgi:hypothetical protein